MPKLVHADLGAEEFRAHVESHNIMMKPSRVLVSKDQNQNAGIEMTMTTDEAATELVYKQAYNNKNDAQMELPSTGHFSVIARFIFQHASFIVVIAPAVCLMLAIIGLHSLEVEDNVSNVWSLTKGSYHEDNTYKDRVCRDREGILSSCDSTTSAMATIAVPRDGGNMMSSDHLTELAARLKTTQEVTVTHEGVTYSLDDVCFNPVSPYTYPCYRLNALDCFQEGDYDWDAIAANTWRASVSAGGVAAAKARAPPQVLANTVCNPECVESGTTLKTSFATDTTCAACLASYTTNNSTQENENAYAAFRNGAVTSGIATYKTNFIYAAIALRVGTGTGAEGGCVVGISVGSADGSVGAACTYDSANDFLADSTCQTCFGSVYGVMTDAQKNAVYYATANAKADTDGLCASPDCRDADGDLYVKNLATTTVNSYSDAALEASIKQTSGYTGGVTTTETTYTKIGIALRAGSGTGGDAGCSSSGGSNGAHCTFSSNLAFLADTTCANCLTQVFDVMDANQKTTALVTATTTLLIATTAAAADAYIAATVLSSVMAFYSNALLAQGMCAATFVGDTADYGPCDMTGAWSSDATCMKCVNAYKGANTGTAVQATYQLYAGLRVTFTDAGIATYKQQTIYTAVASSTCASSCPTFSAAVSYTASIAAGSWATDATCSACFLAAYAAMPEAQQDTTYYATATAALTTAGACASGCRDGDVDIYVKDTVALAVNAYSTTTLDAMLKGAVDSQVASFTPYNYQLNSVPVGQPRFLATGAEDTAILGAASDTCYQWDGGVGLPAVSKFVTLGGSKPGTVKVSASNPLRTVKAMQTVFPFIGPQEIAARVALTKRPGGALTLSEDDAAEVMYKMKEKFEDAFTKGWDDKDDGEVQFAAFSDDVGVIGSFGRTLTEFTTESGPLSLYSYLTLLLLSAIFLGSLKRPVQSQASLGFFGAAMVMLAFLGAIGWTVLRGIALNVVQTWTLPFLMVGIGVDDMFILALAARGAVAKRGGVADEDAFVEAFVEVAIPVTLTSLVNAAMFSVMLASDIPAVYHTAETALYSIILMYFTIITSFSSAVALDFNRQAANQKDFPFCLDAPAEPPALPSSSPPSASTLKTAEEEKGFLWTEFYEPIMKSNSAHVFILVASVALIVTGGVGLTTTKLGLGLSEFFPKGSQGANFAYYQNEYFPLWSATVNWGEIKYHTAEVQMEIVQQFEGVTKDKRITDLPSRFVWTATLAEWAMPESYGLGYCSSSHPNTGGNCGPKLDATCTASWTENTLGLKLKADEGVCQAGSAIGMDSAKSYCPTLELTEAQYANCIKLISSKTSLFSTLSPGINVDPVDKVTPTLPIKYSRASGNSLFMFDLFSTQDYVESITASRKACDDEGPHCWMSGIAYDYWEQYLTIEEWVLTLCGIVVAISFAASTVFFWFNFGALVPSMVGGLVVALTSAATLLTVTGFASLSNVNLCGLSAMSCIMSAGFAVEYSVHVVHRFMAGAQEVSASPHDRALAAMDGLFVPATMAFATSAVGILFLTLSEFEFVLIYFFTPLLTVLLVTYFFGVFTLPVILCRMMGMACASK